jgi:hypothetical protein
MNQGWPFFRGHAHTVCEGAVPVRGMAGAGCESLASPPGLSFEGPEVIGGMGVIDTGVERWGGVKAHAHNRDEWGDSETLTLETEGSSFRLFLGATRHAIRSFGA